jgi:hypothetical protein
MAHPQRWSGSFTPRPDGTTFVSVTNKCFPGSEDQIVQHALDSTEGFAFVFTGLKALLEHSVILNLVPETARWPASASIATARKSANGSITCGTDSCEPWANSPTAK